MSDSQVAEFNPGAHAIAAIRTALPALSDDAAWRVKVNNPDAYEDLSPAQKSALQRWIALAVKPAKTPDCATSYGMKHDFEAVGFYVTNGQFKGAMRAAGYPPVDVSAMNWQFRSRPTLRTRAVQCSLGVGKFYALDHVSDDEWVGLGELVVAAVGKSPLPGRRTASRRARLAGRAQARPTRRSVALVLAPMGARLTAAGKQRPVGRAALPERFTAGGTQRATAVPESTRNPGGFCDSAARTRVENRGVA